MKHIRCQLPLTAGTGHLDQLTLRVPFAGAILKLYLFAWLSVTVDYR
jgi:hypothetical protein